MQKTPRQMSLFGNIPTFNNAIRDCKQYICAAVQRSGLSREQALDKVNDLARAHGVILVKGNGKKLSMETWEKWLNPADETRVPPLKALPVICAALETIKPIQPLAELAGGRLISDQESRLLDWAKAYHRAKNTRQEMKKLEEGI